MSPWLKRRSKEYEIVKRGLGLWEAPLPPSRARRGSLSRAGNGQVLLKVNLTTPLIESQVVKIVERKVFRNESKRRKD